jgi:hypothetical protein
LPNKFIPLMPPGPFTPLTKCAHDLYPIRPGLARYCICCHASGFDWHPSLQLRPGERPAAKPTNETPKFKPRGWGAAMKSWLTGRA